MPHNQNFEEKRYRVAAYVNQDLKQWVTLHAKLRGISESQFVAKILEQSQLNSTKGTHVK